MAEKSALPQGTLDLLILKIVALGPVHGYAIAQRLEQVSRGVAPSPTRFRSTRLCTGSKTADFSPRIGRKRRAGVRPSSIA